MGNEYKLPIDLIDEDFFKRFKAECLDTPHLDRDALEKISEMFGVGKEETGRIACDEMHTHNYSCRSFTDFRTAVVYRLVREVRVLRNTLSIIENLAKSK